MSILHNLKYLDLFPEDTTFIVDGKRNYRTWLGTILSILVLIATIALTILFGQEIYKRKTPSVSYLKSFTKTQELILLSGLYFLYFLIGKEIKLRI